MHIEARGYNGQVIFDGRTVTITRAGFKARISAGKGERRYTIGQMSGIEVKPAGPVVNGYFRLIVSGSPEQHSHVGRRTFDATRDPNSVLFHRRQQDQFEDLRVAIESAISQASSSSMTDASTSAADPLRRLEALQAARDKGLLTTEEFQAKRRDIINDM